MATVIIRLEIDGEAADAIQVIEGLLDAGVPQDAISEHDCDCGPLHVTSATCELEGEP